MVEIIWLVLGMLIGGLAVWFIAKFKFSGDADLQAQKFMDQNQNNIILQKDLTNERERVEELVSRLAATEANNINLQEKLQEQKLDLEKTQERLNKDFKILANEILEEKTKKFTDQNKLSMGELLNPLKEKITEFEKKVESTNKESIERNSALREQITGLKDLNIQMSKETENLTRALKGDNKAQGNWGEFILESVLEKSGLVKNREYFIQESTTSEDGRRMQPDVTIRLPENKTIIVDSKVSLIGYERYFNAESEEKKALNIKRHCESIRTHIKQLSGKSYESLNGRNLDFVLMFIPVEPAFSIAVQNDPNLFTDAYDKNIVIVSPSTLFATLRTIANIWKNEYQNRNAQKIAEESGKLYDKFVGFSNDLIELGKKLKATQTSYEGAMNKLVIGPGNLIKRTEDIKKLGAKTNKGIDQKLIERAED